MVNVSVKAPDIGFTSTDSSKTASTVKNAQSDQFKKLLQGRQDDSQDMGAKEVSKDAKDVKTEKSEKPEESKGGDKDLKEDQTDETVSTDDSQARGLLAAYQMDQGLRPELLTAEPEVVIDMPEAVEAVPEAAVDLTGEMISEAAPEQAEVLTEAAGTAVSGFQAEVTQQETIQVKEPEAQAAAPETVDAVPVRKETVKTQSAGEENQSRPEDHQMEQTAASVVQAPVRNVQEDVIPQEVTTVHVAQPEELPEKLTDQILSKMSEGVQSFEIEIEPENLGKIAVKILYEDGQATVSVLCTEKKALDVLGDHAGEIGGIIDRNLGGETKIIVEKQESDYLNQDRDENQQGKQGEQEQQKEGNKKQDNQDSEQFLQKLRLGLTI